MVAELVVIDGAQGEGGGQVIRSSLALSIVTGQPVQIVNIRAGRKKPGLMRQHLTCVQAAGAICDASVSEVGLGSRELLFSPGQVRPGDYRFSIGSAGSCLLVLQTILPPLMLASSTSRVVLEGGTHNPWAPPYHYLSSVLAPLLRQLGVHLELELHRYGFYPAGGGSVSATITPANQLSGLSLDQRGAFKRRAVQAVVANLPEAVGAREVSTVRRLAGWPAKECQVASVKSPGPGNVVWIEIEYERVTEMFFGFGRRGVPADKVARELWKDFCDYDTREAPVGPYLADQLLLSLGLAVWQNGDNSSHFRTVPLTQHSLTQIEILRRFLRIDIEVREDRGDVEVRC